MGKNGKMREREQEMGVTEGMKERRKIEGRKGKEETGHEVNKKKK